MPKGQYQRKPRAPKVEKPVSKQEAQAFAHAVEAVRLEAPPADPREWVTVFNGVVVPDPEMIELARSEPDLEVERIAALLTQPAAPYPLPERTTETFDDWMDDEPAVVPAHSRIAQMVGEWASLVCPIQHNVFWEVGSSGRELIVELNTEHGTSHLHADAGDWNEADIANALAAMRVQLGV